jgi:hypothetical protein
MINNGLTELDSSARKSPDRTTMHNPAQSAQFGVFGVNAHLSPTAFHPGPPPAPASYRRLSAANMVFRESSDYAVIATKRR